MKINIKATNLKLTPEINDYINNKIGGLGKFIEGYDSSVQAWVEVGIFTKHHQTGEIYRAEIQIRVPHDKKGIRAVSQKETLYAAIDDVREEVKKELTKIKEKKISLVRKGSRLLKKLTSIFYESR
ncbi:MAG: ribosome-associated translation inhibitor RaiA [Patescibacteria group bacterium]